MAIASVSQKLTSS